jgi:hypothetical protein
VDKITALTPTGMVMLQTILYAQVPTTADFQSQSDGNIREHYVMQNSLRTGPSLPNCSVIIHISFVLKEYFRGRETSVHAKYRGLIVAFQAEM